MCEEWVCVVNEHNVLGGWLGQGVSKYSIMNTEFVALEAFTVTEETLHEIRV
jgi:hypothetical protein